MSRPYRKSYPPEATPSPARRWLLALLRRTPGRRARWHQQAKRRRPWLLRPLTVGEQNVLRHKALAQQVADLLAPFRRTRLRGHDELYGLLCDADTRPAVLAQVRALEACLDQIHPEHYKQGQQIARWREEWARATPAVKQRLTEVDKVLVINGYYNGLRLLLAEAKNDIDTIKVLCPLAFETDSTPEPWLGNVSPPNKPTTPTPYS